MFEKILSVVYTVINTCLFTDKRVVSLLWRGIDDVLGNLEELPFTVEVYFIDRFTEEHCATINEYEPGSGDNLTAITVFCDGDLMHIVFSLDGINNLFAIYNPFELYEEIIGTARHESFHVLQYRYLFEHGGLEAIDKLNEAIREVDYFDNVLERGAYEFQYCGVVQDFEKEFAPFVA